MLCVQIVLKTEKDDKKNEAVINEHNEKCKNGEKMAKAADVATRMWHYSLSLGV